MGIPRWLSGKEFTCQAGDVSSIPESGRFPGIGHGNPLQYSCLGNPMDTGTLVDYSLYGLKESDMTAAIEHIGLC